MSYAIFVRDLTQTWGSVPRLLAHDIESREMAERVVQAIVRSYPDFGLDPISMVSWFQDVDGLHEMWVTPHQGAQFPPQHVSARGIAPDFHGKRRDLRSFHSACSTAG